MSNLSLYTIAAGATQYSLWCNNCIAKGHTSGKTRCNKHKCHCGGEYEYTTGTRGEFVWKMCTAPERSCWLSRQGYTALGGDKVPPGQLITSD